MSSILTPLHQLPRTDRMPVYFLGHGSPMNALAHNSFTQSLADIGNSFGTPPHAVLVVSAHWLSRGTRVAVAAAPETIHDFGGFPEELYRVQYPAPGAPVAARATASLLTAFSAAEDDQWGLDHGAWSVLRHVFPDASVPVYQVSIDALREARYHYDLGRELAALRMHGILIIGSGNIVHNLYEVDFAENASPAPWAIEFDEQIKNALLARDDAAMISYEKFSAAARRSVPTNDHYLPLLYTLGSTDKDEKIQFTYEGIEHASLSMRCVRFGA